MRFGTFLVGAVLVGMMALSADAIVVRHNGVQIAQMDFEGLTQGNASAADSSFVDSVGTAFALQVAGTGAGGIPANEGSQFGHCTGCKTGWVFTPTSIDTGELEVEWHVYKSTGSEVMGFSLANDTDISGGTKRAQLEIGFTGLGQTEDSVNIRDPGVNDTGLDVNLDDWNQMRLVYTFNTSDPADDAWTLFVNGAEQPHALTNLNIGTGSGIDRFGIEGTGSGVNAGVDIVPEPASAALLLIGAGLLGGRRRR
ncbi:MAG: hypothetical protein CMJ18_17280 [Phycisphaeraceae bacterium]|nr:hypothetical protein [Phycisphaeraceae bacterium]